MQWSSPSRLFRSSLSARSACQASLCLGNVIIIIFLIAIIIVTISIVITDIFIIIIIITKIALSWNTFIQSDRLQKCPASALASARYFLTQLKIISHFSSSVFSFSHFSSSIFSHSSKLFLISPLPPTYELIAYYQYEKWTRLRIISRLGLHASPSSRDQDDDFQHHASVLQHRDQRTGDYLYLS